MKYRCVRIDGSVLLLALLIIVSCGGAEIKDEPVAVSDIELFSIDWGSDNDIPEPATVPETYVVEKGDSLFRISRKFGISISDIRKINNLSTDVIYPGMMISLKKGTSAVSSAPQEDFSLFIFEDDATPSSSGPGPSFADAVRKNLRSTQVSSKGYQWPLKGRVLRYYNPGSGMYGLVISSDSGSDVAASKAGTVAFRGYIAGLGNTVIIEHQYRYLTLYGHLSSFAVEAGETIQRGDVIGKSGTSGNSPVPALHFRVYVSYNSTRDPSDYLP